MPCSTTAWVNSGGGTRPLFSADGEELFFRRGGEIFAAPVDLKAAEPRIEAATRRFAGFDVPGYSMAIDGEAVLLLADDAEAENDEAPVKTGLVFVVHFGAELRADRRPADGS